ncbi:jun-like transcription factor [Pestalotiopsis sp. IQ-011]
MSNFDQTRKGFLVPEWFQEQPVTTDNMNLASIFLGLSLGVAIFSASKALRQSWQIWRRFGRINTYITMIWLHWCANIALGFINWLYMWGTITPSFWLWLGILIVWVAQTQLLVQIIINRIALLMMVRSQATRLKWSVAGLMTAINISVFCIWIPARLQINDTYIAVNYVWDRVEKCIFLVVDLGLNIYFIRMVQNRLIANGLTKYNRLLRVNVLMVVINISLDVVFIGLMSLPNALVYLNFQSFAYMAKLHIEMNMAELIGKVVRASNHESGERTHSTDRRYNKKGNSSAGKTQRTFMDTLSRAAGHNRTHVELGSQEYVSDTELQRVRNGNNDDRELHGIQRTIITQVVHTKAHDDDDLASESTSERHLNDVSSV